MCQGKYVDQTEDGNTQHEDIVDLRGNTLQYPLLWVTLQYPVQWVDTEERRDKTAGKYVNRPDHGNTQLEDIMDLILHITLYSVLTQKKAKSYLMNTALDSR